MRIKKYLALAMSCVLSISAFTACGDSGSGDKVTAKVIEIDLTSEEYAFGVDKEQPELLEQVNEFIEEIKEDGTLDKICNNYFGDGTPVPVESAKLDSSKDQLVVATNASFEPFEYIGDDGKAYGIDLEIAALYAEAKGLELVVKNIAFDA